MFNRLYKAYDKINKEDAWQPFFRQPSTWIAIGVGAIFVLLITGSFKAGAWLSFAVRTEVVEYSCKEQFVKEVTTIDIWTTRRYYDRSSAPSCSWDIDKDTYCASRDSNGLCQRWDHEYDYSLRGWERYKTITNNHSEFNRSHLRQYGGSEFKINTTLTYHGKFRSNNGKYYWLANNSQFVVGKTYSVVQGVRKQRIRKLNNGK